MYEIKVREDVLGVKLTVARGEREELDAFVREEFPGAEGLPFGTAGYTQSLTVRSSGLTEYLVTIGPLNDLVDFAAVLSHECIHVAIMALKGAGIKWDDEELICYYSEYLFSRSYRKLIDKIQGDK